MRTALAAGLAMFLTGCGGGDEPAANIALANNGVPLPAPSRAAPNATGPGTALGLTYLQLEDADLLDAAGRDLAEVHEIDADRAGTIGGLVVKLKDGATPGRRVRIGLAGLTPVPDGDDDWDLRTTATADQLAALPTYAKQ